MEYVKMLMYMERHYCEDGNSIKIWILGSFLANDVYDYVTGFREWALDDTQKYIASNATQLERRNNNIILNELFSEEDDGGPFLEIPKAEFIKILNEWEKICKEKPKEVMIIKEDDTYRFETKD